MEKIQPKTLPGFMELLPEEQIVFNQMKETIQKTYEKYGFLPIDTPVIEASEVLLAKAGGETEKQIYNFKKGENDLTLRFDLTVPLAKYVAEHYNQLTFPFKRYQIGKVYRGERPQRGRYREFYQCDIDVIGDGELSLFFDAEMPMVIYNTFKALGLDEFCIFINNRKILEGLFKSINAENQKIEIMRIIDKLEKIGEENTIKELKTLGLNNESINTIINFININGKPLEILEKLENIRIDNPEFNLGKEELKKVIQFLKAFGISDKYFAIDLKIARGLDYYTGTVYETFIDGHRDMGSICSGGRYNNLSDFYTDKKMPGVGISIGLSRLYFVLNELNLIKVENKSISKVIVIPMTENFSYSIKVANILRENGINTELYCENKKIKAKFKYADKLKVPYAIIIGEDEIKTEKLAFKNMETGEQDSFTIDEILTLLKN